MMRDPALRTASLFSEALQSIAVSWHDRTRHVRGLLGSDPLERMVPQKLLSESLAKLLDEKKLSAHPVVVFMDRFGGGDGARAAAGILPLLKEHISALSFVHVSFSTPTSGLGTLVRSVLKGAGAKNGVDVQVVVHNRPSLGLSLSGKDAEDLLGGCDLAVTFSPGGSAGVGETHPPGHKDLLAARSHVCVLSYVDPESLLARLGGLRQALEKDPLIDALRFWCQVETESGHYDDIGYVILSAKGGDAGEKLWPLIDNARRRRYRICIEPMKRSLPAGDVLVCPCRTVIEADLAETATALRILPSGGQLVAVARGRDTMS